ncbi:MAG TPA: serine hydrolase [Kofleriaceae bacterium]|nr:serine hydrolase [Kofleriaceae bacterium]
MRSLVFCALLGMLATRAARADGLPEIRSRTAVALDVATGNEIFGKNADEIRPIASTTKIFVAMAVRKHLDLDAWTEITKVDAHHAAGGARTRLDIGQKFRNIDLLRAMLIASDNRAPTALGRAAGMTPDELVDAMNRVAKDLHLKRTRFTDPTGLRGNTSTAREMAIALRAALKDDTVRAILRQDAADITSKDHHARIHYSSTNQPLVVGRWNVIGGKTGYTRPAGYCFITAARFDDREVVMAFLGADGKLTRFDDFNRVATWIDRGAPGGNLASQRPRSARPAREGTHGRIASH